VSSLKIPCSLFLSFTCLLAAVIPLSTIGECIGDDAEACLAQHHNADVVKSHQPARKTTVLVYIAGDNDLHPFIRNDVRQMQRVGSDENTNILVFLNTKFPGQKKVTRKLYITREKILQHGPDETRDSGDPATLVEACRWAHDDFPSEKFVLILWDHGTGSLNRMIRAAYKDEIDAVTTYRRNVLASIGREEDRAVCFDFTTGHFLTDAKLSEALAHVVKNQRGGKKIDVLAFDACLMADIEIAFVLQPYVDYMVSSQEVVPGTGYGYDVALGPLAQNPAMEPRDIALHFVQAYYQTYRHEKDYTHSAYDLAALPVLVDELNLVARWFEAFLKAPQARQVRDVLRWCGHPHYCTHFENANYVDLSHFCSNCSRRASELPLQPNQGKQAMLTYLDGVQNCIQECVIANVRGSKYKHACGMSIYMPSRSIDPTYPHLIWSQKTHWYPFLRQLFSVRYEHDLADFDNSTPTPPGAIIPEQFNMAGELNMFAS